MLQSWRHLLIIITVLILSKTSTTSILNDPNYDCPQNGNSYISGSTFDGNLTYALFTQLPLNASKFRFANFTSGSGTDQVYAVYYCRGDLDLQTCQNCVQTAAKQIVEVCKLMKQAIVWYEECTLRYANHTLIFSEDGPYSVYRYYNRSGVVNAYHLDPYKQIFDNTMDALIQRATYNRSQHVFAMSEINLSSSSDRLRGLVQCTPDITSTTCDTCLRTALKLQDTWANTMIMLPSCLVRFDLYGTPNNYSPPPPSSLPRKAPYLVLLIVPVLAILGGFFIWHHHRSKARAHTQKEDHMLKNEKGDPYKPAETSQSEQEDTISENYRHKDLYKPTELILCEQIISSSNYNQQDASTEATHVESIISESSTSRGRFHGLERFTYAEVEEMTSGFKTKLGEGGYGVVYYGRLRDSIGTKVAVKVFSKNDAPKQFSTEIDVLGRISHKNLVSLIGYCEEGTYLALIYEYMARGDLNALLADHSTCLSWTQRIHIAIDMAQGLDYLHNGCTPPIVHRDVKPANILLNESFGAKVADFGISKIFPAEYVTFLQTRVVGTPGYLDPQYNATGHLDEKSDVYSFGVVLLVLITGKTAVVSRDMNLVMWVRSMAEKGDIESILEPRLTQEIDNYANVWKATEVALRCVHVKTATRPKMTRIVSDLKDCLAQEINSGPTASAPVSMEMTTTLPVNPTPR